MCLCRVCSCSSITTVVPKLGKKTSNKEKTSAEPWVTFLGPGFPLPQTYLCWAAPGAELPHNTSVPEWVRLCPCNSTEQQCSQRPALHQTHKVSVLPIKANITPPLSLTITRFHFLFSLLPSHVLPQLPCLVFINFY